MNKYVKGIKAECINPRCEKEQNMLGVSKTTGRQSTCLSSDYQLKERRLMEGKILFSYHKGEKKKGQKNF